MKRNYDKHTPKEEVRLNILRCLETTNHMDTCSMSAIGYIAYKGYDFKKPQGAALAVCRFVREMLDEKLIRLSDNYFISDKGLQELKRLENAKRIREEKDGQ